MPHFTCVNTSRTPLIEILDLSLPREFPFAAQTPPLHGTAIRKYGLIAALESVGISFADKLVDGGYIVKIPQLSRLIPGPMHAEKWEVLICRVMCGVS